jgi:pyruvate-formate lyase-activating enzyme
MGLSVRGSLMVTKLATTVGRRLAGLRRAWRVRRARLPHHLARLKTRLSPGRGKASPLAGRFCQNPFTQLDLEQGGVAFTCCSGWLPTPIGNLGRQTLQETWNGQTIRRIRASIFDGSFRYCRHDICPHIQNDSLPTLQQAEGHPVLGDIVRRRQTRIDVLPSFINLVNDPSCNLYCPSCRNERINHREGPAFEEISAIQHRLLDPLLEQSTGREFTISVTGSGDPFASRAYRELLYSLDGGRYPGLRFSLQTNGVLLTPRNWQRMEGIHDNISQVIVSFDAATPETYAITRRGGDWERLLANCRFLGDKRRAGELRFLRFDFVVQKANFREMPDFVRLGRQLSADRVLFSRLMDWGAWPAQTFREQCVWNENHPLRPEFLSVMRDPLLSAADVDLGNMSSFRALAMAA